MWEILFGGIGGGALGLAFKAVWDGWNRRIELVNTNNLTNRRETRLEFEELLNRQQLQIEDLRRGERDLLERMLECSKGYERAVTWIEHLEEKLDVAGVKYRKWCETPE